MGKDLGAAPVGAVSVHRSAFSETYRLADGRRISRHSPRQQHYQLVPGADPSTPEGEWRDVVLEFRRERGRLVLDTAPYVLEIAQNGIGFTYRSRHGGDGVQVTLVRVDGSPSFATPQPVAVGNEIRWDGVAPGVDFFLVAREGSIQVNKRLRSPLAARTFEYEYVEGTINGFKINFQGRGLDNEDEIELGRTRLDGRRSLEVILTPHDIDLAANPGKKTYLVTEEWTGRAVRVNPSTRAPEWTDEVQYPLVIDPTFSQSISSDNNDCNETNATTNAVSGTGPNGKVGNSGANTFKMGFRFTSVTVTSTATITSATLNLTMGSAPLNSPGAVIRGVEAANPGVWDGTNRPSTATATTASTTVTDFTGASANDVKSIVEEILADTAYTNGNAMAFTMHDTVGSGYNICYPQQVATFGSPTPASLSIVWSTGSSSVTATPGAATISLASSAQSVSASAVSTPGAATISLASSAQSVSASAVSTPAAASIQITGLAATVLAESPYPVVESTATSSEASNTTTHTVSKPTGLAAGELWVIFAATDGNSTVTGPAGFTELFNTSDTHTTLCCWYKTATGSEPASVTYTTS